MRVRAAKSNNWKKENTEWAKPEAIVDKISLSRARGPRCGSRNASYNNALRGASARHALPHNVLFLMRLQMT